MSVYTSLSCAFHVRIVRAFGTRRSDAQRLQLAVVALELLVHGVVRRGLRRSAAVGGKRRNRDVEKVGRGVRVARVKQARQRRQRLALALAHAHVHTTAIELIHSVLESVLRACT